MRGVGCWIVGRSGWVVDCLEPWMEPNAWVIFEWRACIRRWRAADAERLAGKLE